MNCRTFPVIQMQWQLLHKIQTLGINVCVCVRARVCVLVWATKMSKGYHKTPDATKFMPTQMKMQIYLNDYTIEYRYTCLRLLSPYMSSSVSKELITMLG